MNDDEWKKLSDFQERTKFPRERLARTLILEGQVHENPPAEYGAVLRELHRIGLNMNQIAVKANAYGFVDEPKLLEAIRSVNEMRDIIRKSFT